MALFFNSMKVWKVEPPLRLLTSFRKEVRWSEVCSIIKFLSQSFIDPFRFTTMFFLRLSSRCARLNKTFPYSHRSVSHLAPWGNSSLFFFFLQQKGLWELSVVCGVINHTVCYSFTSLTTPKLGLDRSVKKRRR